MGFFRKGRLGNIARALALVTALSAACNSKSKDFLLQVSSLDREAAAELIKNPKKKDKWLQASFGLANIQKSLKDYKPNPTAISDPLSPEVWENLILIFQENKGGFSSEPIQTALRMIESAGLSATYNKWMEILRDCDTRYDSAMADKIYEAYDQTRLNIKKDKRAFYKKMKENRIKTLLVSAITALEYTGHVQTRSALRKFYDLLDRLDLVIRKGYVDDFNW